MTNQFFQFPNRIYFLNNIFFLALLIFLIACDQQSQKNTEISDNENNPQAATTNTLNLKEANVTNVSYDSSSNIMSVTLLHDDDNETGYADWWQVETLNGTLIGKRILTHRHSSEEFTRSLSVEFDEEQQYVVVRGHDQDHGYGGQVIIYHLLTNNLEKIQQGDQPRDFTNYPN